MYVLIVAPDLRANFLRANFQLAENDIGIENSVHSLAQQLRTLYFL
jgi:hypothetical protein